MMVQEHNKRGESYQMAINQFADMSKSEIEGMKGISDVEGLIKELRSHGRFRLTETT